MVKHIVLFKYTADTSREMLAETEKKFRGLPSLIEEIQGFESGADMSIEQKTHGFTHAYVLTFKNSADRDTYIIHPDHRAFSEAAGPWLDDVLVFDYETE